MITQEAHPGAHLNDSFPSPTVAFSHSTWRAWFQEQMAAPVDAVIELTEMLLHDRDARQLEQLISDLNRIQDAGMHLLELVRRIVDDSSRDNLDLTQDRELRHDLRTPLNHIIGYSELWLEDTDPPLPENIATELEQIRVLGQQALRQLDELIELSRTLPTSQSHETHTLPEMLREVIGDLSASSAHAAPKPSVEKSNVLVVDDNEINRDVLHRWLRRMGHDVETAGNGRQALELAKRRSFDLMLLDIILPEMNGYQVLRLIKSDPELQHLPVIMISSLEDVDSVVHCIELGAEDYLPKPFNPVLLQARINACLEKKHLRDREASYLELIKQEQKRSDELLHVILPASIVNEMKTTNEVAPRRFDNVAVMFCDIVGFTPFCDRNSPEVVVANLQKVIESWEEIALRYQVEKIKTIGDAFMAACGLLIKPDDHPVAQAVRCGLEMIRATEALVDCWTVRVGIHFGSLVAGVIGRRQFLFDLWGDTVNTAARMESHGVSGAVVLSGDAWQSIQDRATGQSLGILPIKGKGEMEMVRFDSFQTEAVSGDNNDH